MKFGIEIDYSLTKNILYIPLLRSRGGPEINASLLVHEVVGSNPGNYQCVFFNAHLFVCISKFILNITDIGEGKHHGETWKYNQYESEVTNLS